MSDVSVPSAELFTKSISLPSSLSISLWWGETHRDGINIHSDCATDAIVSCDLMARLSVLCGVSELVIISFHIKAAVCVKSIAKHCVAAEEAYIFDAIMHYKSVASTV